MATTVLTANGKQDVNVVHSGLIFHPATAAIEIESCFSSAPSADNILEQARKEQANRAQFYDAPAGERSMAKTVAAFNALHGTQLTEVQGWHFMTLLKLVRAAQGQPHLDNYIDGANYFALAGEAAMKETK